MCSEPTGILGPSRIAVAQRRVHTACPLPVDPEVFCGYHESGRVSVRDRSLNTHVRGGRPLRSEFRVLMAVLLAAAVPTRAAEVPWEPGLRGEPPIVDHPPFNTGGGASDLSFRLDPSPAELWQQLADDFVLSTPGTVRRIVWWGFYGDTFDSVPEPPPVTERFRIRFYGARPGDGLPDDGNILLEESFLDPSRVATGRIVFVGPLAPEFIYQVDLPTPLSLEAGTPYWLEVVQAGEIESLFRWEFSIADQNGQAFRNAATGDWRHTVSINADTAYQLLAIPEPATLTLWLIVLCVVVRARKGTIGIIGTATVFADVSALAR